MYHSVCFVYYCLLKSAVIQANTEAIPSLKIFFIWTGYARLNCCGCILVVSFIYESVKINSFNQDLFSIQTKGNDIIKMYVN